MDDTGGTTMHSNIFDVGSKTVSVRQVPSTSRPDQRMQNMHKLDAWQWTVHITTLTQV